MTDCDDWPGYVNPDGYGWAWDAEARKVRFTHIMAWEEARGPVTEGKELHHKCGNKRCRNVEHLEELTRAEHNRLNPNVKLTREDVLGIMALLRVGWGQQSIADLYGISRPYVSQLKAGMYWQEITRARRPRKTAHKRLA